MSAGSTPTTHISGPTTTAANDPYAALQQALQAQAGVTLSANQATCLANTQLDPAVLTAAAADVYGMPPSVMLAVLNCEIDIFNLPSS